MEDAHGIDLQDVPRERSARVRLGRDQGCRRRTHPARPVVRHRDPLEGSIRTVTFAKGLVAREQIVTIDDENRRVVYGIVGGRPTHHNAFFQVFPGPDGKTSVLWVTDLLPDDVREPGSWLSRDHGHTANPGNGLRRRAVTPRTARFACGEP